MLQLWNSVFNDRGALSSLLHPASVTFRDARPAPWSSSFGLLYSMWFGNVMFSLTKTPFLIQILQWKIALFSLNRSLIWEKNPTFSHSWGELYSESDYLSLQSCTLSGFVIVLYVILFSKDGYTSRGENIWSAEEKERSCIRSAHVQLGHQLQISVSQKRLKNLVYILHWWRREASLGCSG